MRSALVGGRSCREQLTHASPDLLRHQLATSIDALTGTQADAFRGADHGARSPERANVRNGYRHPDFAPRTRLSSSQVSRTAQDLDEQIATFRTGPLDAGPHGSSSAGLGDPRHDLPARTAYPRRWGIVQRPWQVAVTSHR